MWLDAAKSSCLFWFDFIAVSRHNCLQAILVSCLMLASECANVSRLAESSAEYSSFEYRTCLCGYRTRSCCIARLTPTLAQSPHQTHCSEKAMSTIKLKNKSSKSKAFARVVTCTCTLVHVCPTCSSRYSVHYYLSSRIASKLSNEEDESRQS